MIAMIDREGLIHTGRDASPEKSEFAIDSEAVPAAVVAAGGAAPLADVIDAWRPQVLIGTTAVQGRFDEATIRAMARVADRPVVMALSNPITSCEVTPTDVLAWSDGRALVATGSPFDPVRFRGELRQVGQGNNAFIFPGLGLGAIVAEAREVTVGMLSAAASALAREVAPERLASGVLYPPINDLPALARAIACDVVREARDSGYGRYLADEEIEAAVDAAIWEPAYRPYRPVLPG
jgi:malate dehydrogenase (oxaloacetate-decarboxylating)